MELEGFKRCSESLLWKLMMSFYDRRGVSSWSQGIVPHFITCNAFIGRAYARVLAGFLEDCKRQLNGLQQKMKMDPEQPLYIVELGASFACRALFLYIYIYICIIIIIIIIYIITFFLTLLPLNFASCCRRRSWKV